LPILFNLLVTCPSYSFFWSLAHLIDSFGHLPILFTLLVTCTSYSLFDHCPSYSLFWSLAHLIHSFGHSPILFTLLVTCPSYSHNLLATFPRYSKLFILCSFNSILKKPSHLLNLVANRNFGVIFLDF
jgi:small neutral amino acid transporter SnatA (MarC family)